MFLEQIVAATRQRLADISAQGQGPALEAAARSAPPPRDFAAALSRPRLSLIAEIKRASPSRGLLKPDLDVARLARAYARGGAAALSVLTEPHFFQGSLDDLETAARAVPLPILDKDFILEPIQIYQARAHGAAAVLLIAALLPPAQLRALRAEASALGMAALVEVHQEAEVRQAVAAGAQIIGINNRNLVDFTVDINTTFRLRPLIPEGITVVSESGLGSPEDIARLWGIGVKAVLIGEALVTSARPDRKIRELLAAVQA